MPFLFCCQGQERGAALTSLADGFLERVMHFSIFINERGCWMSRRDTGN